jgi:diguanylate cyclase (GGDEF)-like protein
MTLHRQLFLSLTLIFLVMLAASVTVNLYNAQRHLHEKMTLHARDTANSLAYSISKSIAEKKSSAADSIIGVAFEHGDFSAITYRDNQGKSLAERRKPPQDSAIPDWFIRWLSTDIQAEKANIMSEWSQVGTVLVTADPSSAYQDLWVSFCEQLALFGVACALTYVLSSLALNILLKPLHRVEEQAAAMCERHFIEQQPLPKTRELRRMVEAINRTSRKLKIIFREQLALTESLRAQSHLDPVTGLSNRREFNARLQSVAESETGNGGCLLILQASNFGRYNLQHGHEAGDECLRAIAAKLQYLATEAPDAIISRRAGADFAIYVPRANQERAKTMASHLIAQLAHLDILFGHQIHIGAACCEVLRADHKLLSEADLALRQAQSRGRSDWQIYQEGDVVQIAREARQWYAALTRILQDRQITFHYQPIFRQQENEAMAAEIFCRITIHDKLICAGIFLPMAERFGMAEAFDRLIIDEARIHSEKHHCTALLCINLSPHSVRSSDFVDWLSSYLNDHPVFAARLIIETSEYLVWTGADKIQSLCEMLHLHGSRLSLDHFGIHNAAFGYLHSLPLDFLKIDRSFIRDIHLDTDNQFYVQSLVQIAHSCEITILAEGIENLQEWECLRSMGIDGGQGYLLGKPDSKINTIRS